MFSPWSKKWKESGATADIPEYCISSKMTLYSGRAIMIEDFRKPMADLEEWQRSTAHVESGRRRQSLRESYPYLKFVVINVGDRVEMERCSGQITEAFKASCGNKLYSPSSWGKPCRRSIMLLMLFFSRDREAGQSGKMLRFVFRRTTTQTMRPQWNCLEQSKLT